MLALFAVPAMAQDNTTTTGNETAGGNETANETPTTGGATGGSGPDFSVPADAPAPDEGGIVRVLTFSSVEEGACADGAPAPCWDVSTFAANPGDTVVLVANLLPRNGFHNLHANEGEALVAADPGPKTAQGPNLFHKVALKMPADGQITFICDVHPTNMIGHVLTPAALAAQGGGHASVPTLGVHFLAYWVGVIAFALLFIFYGVTFFLFKYNETPTTTDHWDRGEAGASNKRLAPYASLLAVVIAMAVIAAVIFVALR
jgi:hypothetical protein